ncbi:MAG: hypothetical protein KatS3mg058_4378 [Roseiflexus sp.]|nr:MAG: hypothetical protein KatS3mg058_4378 [Roseiflexus sp.]
MGYGRIVWLVAISLRKTPSRQAVSGYVWERANQISSEDAALALTPHDTRNTGFGSTPDQTFAREVHDRLLRPSPKSDRLPELIGAPD